MLLLNFYYLRDNKMDEYNVVRVALLGATESGKSCLASALAGQRFMHGYVSTIGANMIHKYFPREYLKILVWDLSGSERYEFIIQSYIQTCDMVLLCYDSHDYVSYRKLLEQRESFKRLIGNKPVAVVATKTDLNTFTHGDCGRELAVRLDIPFISSSALTGDVHDVMSWVRNYAHQKFFHYLQLEDVPRPDDDEQDCGCEKFCLIQ
jgi:Ras-related protein Rab-11A